MENATSTQFGKDKRMTPLSKDTEAALERLCRKHGVTRDAWRVDSSYAGQVPQENALAALRELLRAVQERDAELAERGDNLAIRKQTYGDLFPEEKK